MFFSLQRYAFFVTRKHYSGKFLFVNFELIDATCVFAVRRPVVPYVIFVTKHHLLGKILNPILIYKHPIAAFPRFRKNNSFQIRTPIEHVITELSFSDARTPYSIPVYLLQVMSPDMPQALKVNPLFLLACHPIRIGSLQFCCII